MKLRWGVSGLCLVAMACATGRAVDAPTPWHPPPGSFAATESEPAIDCADPDTPPIPTGVVPLARPGTGDPNQSGTDGRTGLFTAVDQEDEDAIVGWLQAGADPNHRDATGETPLHRAARHGSLAVADRLLKAGARPHPTDCGGRTPLDWAAWRGDVALVRRLIEAGPTTPEAGVRALAHAAGAGAIPVLEDLERAGVGPPSRGPTGKAGADPVAGGLELADGGVIGFPDSPMHAAALHDQAEAIGWLANAGWSPSREASGFTPGDLAERVGARRAREVLLGLTKAPPEASRAAKTPAPEETPKKKLRVYDFSGDDIDGELVKPDGEFMAPRVTFRVAARFDVEFLAVEAVPEVQRRVTLAERLWADGAEGRVVDLLEDAREELRMVRPYHKVARSRLEANLARALVRDGQSARSLALTEPLRVTKLPPRPVGGGQAEHMRWEAGVALQAHVLETRAFALAQTGDDPQAKKLLFEVFQLRSQHLRRNRVAQASAMSALADLLTEEGKFEAARDLYEKACELARPKGRARPEQQVPFALCQTAVATLAQRMGDHMTAIGQLRWAGYVLEKAGPTRLRGLIHNSLAESFRRREDWARAIEALDEADALVAHWPESDPLRLILATTRAQVALDQGDASAVTVLERVLATEDPKSGPTEVSMVERWSELARARAMSGDVPGAEDALAEALARAVANGGPIARWQAFDTASRVQHRLGHLPLAIWFGKAAARELEVMRREVSKLGKDQVKLFLEDKAATWRHLAAMLVDAGRLREAHQALAGLRTEELHEFSRRSGGEATDGAVPFVPGEAAWRLALDGVAADAVAQARALSEARQRGEDTSTRREANDVVRKAHKAFRDFLGALDAEMAEMDARQAKALGEKQLKHLRGLSRHLEEGVVQATYLVLPDRVNILLTTPDVVVVRDASVGARALASEVHALREAVQNPAVDPRHAAKTLYDQLIAPIADDLAQAKAHTLLVAPDGVLRYLPFAALHDGKGYLLERYRVVRHDDTRGSGLARPPSNEPLRVAALGATTFDGLNELPGVATELDAIVKVDAEDADGVLPGVVRLDEAFDLEAVRSVLDDGFPAVHLASHFVLGHSESKTWLALGGSGRLSLETIQDEALYFGAVDLLALSACETGVGPTAVDGSEVSSLASLIQTFGVPSVLASLWPVGDASTSALMSGFYRHRKAGDDKAESLRQAQLELLSGKVGIAPPEPEPEPPEGDPDFGMMLEPEEGPEAPLPALAPSRGAAPLDADADAAPNFSAPDGAPWAHPYYWAPFVLMGSFK